MKGRKGEGRRKGGSRGEGVREEERVRMGEGGQEGGWESVREKK